VQPHLLDGGRGDHHSVKRRRKVSWLRFFVAPHPEGDVPHLQLAVADIRVDGVADHGAPVLGVLGQDHSLDFTVTRNISRKDLVPNVALMDSTPIAPPHDSRNSPSHDLRQSDLSNDEGPHAPQVVLCVVLVGQPGLQVGQDLRERTPTEHQDSHGRRGQDQAPQRHATGFSEGRLLKRRATPFPMNLVGNTRCDQEQEPEEGRNGAWDHSSVAG
jgi:hypothetical protein